MTEFLLLAIGSSKVLRIMSDYGNLIGVSSNNKLEESTQKKNNTSKNITKVSFFKGWSSNAANNIKRI